MLERAVHQTRDSMVGSERERKPGEGGGSYTEIVKMSRSLLGVWPLHTHTQAGLKELLIIKGGRKTRRCVGNRVGEMEGGSGGHI